MKIEKIINDDSFNRFATYFDLDEISQLYNFNVEELSPQDKETMENMIAAAKLKAVANALDHLVIHFSNKNKGIDAIRMFLEKFWARNWQMTVADDDNKNMVTINIPNL